MTSDLDLQRKEDECQQQRLDLVTSDAAVRIVGGKERDHAIGLAVQALQLSDEADPSRPPEWADSSGLDQRQVAAIARGIRDDVETALNSNH